MNFCLSCRHTTAVGQPFSEVFPPTEFPESGALVYRNQRVLIRDQRVNGGDGDSEFGRERKLRQSRFIIGTVASTAVVGRTWRILKNGQAGQFGATFVSTVVTHLDEPRVFVQELERRKQRRIPSLSTATTGNASEQRICCFGHRTAVPGRRDPRESVQHKPADIRQKRQ